MKRTSETVFDYAKHRQTHSTEEIIRHGFDVNGIDEQHKRRAIHFEAAKGDTESVKQLLAHGAEINVADCDGRTPLYYAVDRDHPATVDLLVFCGADSRVKDKYRDSPESICRPGDVLTLLRETHDIVYAVQQGYISIFRTLLTRNTLVHMESIGLKIKTPEGFSKKDVCIMCRRVRPEYSRCGLDPINKELLISDTFEFRVSEARYNGQIKVMVPLYSKPKPYEEVHMKTNKNQKLQESSTELVSFEKEESLNKWICTVDLDLQEILSLVLVTRPRVEHFKVGRQGGTFVSSVDSLIKIDIPEKSFSDKGELTLEVIPRPTYTKPELGVSQIEVIAVSNIYEINHTNNEQPQNEVTVTLPLPRDCQQKSKLYVVSRRTPTWDEPELSLWDIVSINPDQAPGQMTFKTSHFSSEIAVAVSMPREDLETDEEERDEVKKAVAVSMLREDPKTDEKERDKVKKAVTVSMLRADPKTDQKERDEVKKAVAVSMSREDPKTDEKERDEVKKAVAVSMSREDPKTDEKERDEVKKAVAVSMLREDPKTDEKEGDEVKKAAAFLYLKAKNREHKVSFVVMLNANSATNKYKTLVECTMKNPYKRLSFWETEGFQDQKPSYPRRNKFNVIPKTCFEFTVSEAAKVNDLLKLEFHPKRKNENFIQFEIERKHYDQSNALVKIIKKVNKRPKNSEDEVFGLVTLHLDGIMISAVDEESVADIKELFTNDQFLEKVSSKLSDEWYKVGLYLGVAKRSLDMPDILVKDKKIKMLTNWRNNCRTMEDQGVRSLTSALNKVGRKDVEEIVIQELDCWLEKHETENDEFTKWAKRARSKTWEVPKGTVMPYSEDFLKCLVDQLGLREDLLELLWLPKTQISDIKDPNFFRMPERQMFELLCQSKKRFKTELEFFKAVDINLGELNLKDSQLWLRKTTAKWCRKPSTEEEEMVVEQLQSYFEEEGYM